MHEPEPAARGASDETPLDLLDIEWFAPGFGQDLEAKPPAASMTHEALAEFSVGQDETGRSIQRQLTGNRIVGHRAASEHDLRALRTGELAKTGAGLLHLVEKLARSVRNGRAPQSSTHGRLDGDG